MNMPIDAPAPQRAKPATRAKPKKRMGRRPNDAAERAAAEAEAQARLAAAPRRQNPRQLNLKQNREVPRETVRRGSIVVEGRGGEMLTRRRISQGPDLYELPKSEIPSGWSYQWNPVTVLNEQMVSVQVQMYENGWRPVPAERHPGRWLKPGATGEIVVNGLRLEERPQSMTDEALAEDKLAARKQMRDQTDALKLTQKLPEGFTDQVYGRRNVIGAHGSVQMKIDPTLDIPMAGDYQQPED